MAIRMSSHTAFAESRVAIWGLGLMGGSLALALAGKCAALTGFDPDPHAVELAAASGVFAEVASTPNQAFAQADLIVLAAPVRAILKQLEALPRLHPGSCVVLDLGSTKRQILAAMAALPAWFDPVGGHPMCGNEHSSFAHAQASFFVGAPFALLPLPSTSAAGQAMATACVQACGAQPQWLDTETHDRWTAHTSHLPYLLAAALTITIPAGASSLAGPGLHSATRLAASSPEMMLDILLTNQDFLLEALHTFQQNLAGLEAALSQEDEIALTHTLQKAHAARAALLSGGSS